MITTTMPDDPNAPSEAHELDHSQIKDLTGGHIFRRFDGELDHLHHLVLEMGGLALSQLRVAMAAFKGQDTVLAREVLKRDETLDRMEVSADEEIFKLLVRQSPVGSDLRVVFSVTKSVSDIERIGDEAVRIAGLVSQIFSCETLLDSTNRALLGDINRIGDKALLTLESAVDLFDTWDEDSALSVIAGNRDMGDEFTAEVERLMHHIVNHAHNIGFAVSMVLMVKSLERITHHAQSLVEYAFFEMKGLDIRGNPRSA